MLSDLERMIAVDAIKTLRARFCRALDARNWDALASMVTDGIRLLVANESGNPALGLADPLSFNGRDAFLAFVRQVIGTGPTIHVATMPEIEVHGPDTAHGVWLIQGYSESAREHGLTLGIGYETVEDDYVRIDGHWRIDGLTARMKAVL
ncbi:MAG: nuclear transport factor 2 family protein [Sphingobium sp.]